MGQPEFQMPAILREGTQPPPPVRPPPRTGRLLSGRVRLIGAVVVAAGLVGLVLWVRSPLSELTEASLEAARRRWRQAGIMDYDLRLQISVSGSETSEYLVKVREGLVAELIRNGVPASSNSPGDFSVEGLFDTLARELDMKRSRTEGFGNAAGNTLLRVRFDERLGFVRKYVRVVGGTARSSEIKLLELRPLQ